MPKPNSPAITQITQATNLIKQKEKNERLLRQEIGIFPASL